MRALQKIKNPETLVWLGLGLWWIVNLVQAGCTELADDEAYYHMFAGRLAWGYFDHPPMTALLVHLGGFLGGEIGVRFFFTVLQPIYLFALWRIIRPRETTVRDAGLFLLIAAAMPILQLYGFIAVPDGPLMLFTALFLWSYKYFTERSNWLAVLFIAVSLAGLAYSKYHGALVLLFTVLSNLRLLKNPKFYAACLLAALLVIPHLWWQYAHDWVSLRYHLAGRNRDFEFGFVTEYLLNLFAIFNPFLFPVFIAAWWENRAVRPVDRALSCIAAGFILFFLSSTLRGYVQPQWEIPATFGIIALLFGFIREREKLRHYTLWVCWITLALVALTRIEMIFNPLGFKFQVFDNRETYAQLADTAQGRPIIFNGSYTAAAKYHFYTGGESYAQPVVTYRTSHYQLRDDDTRMAGRAVLTEVLDSTPGAQEIKLANGKRFHYLVADPFIPVRKIIAEITGLPPTVNQGDSLHLDVTLHNPYPYVYILEKGTSGSETANGTFGKQVPVPAAGTSNSTVNSGKEVEPVKHGTAPRLWPLTVNIVWRHLGDSVLIVPLGGISGVLPPEGKLQFHATTVVPELRPGKRYETGIMLTDSPMLSWFNGTAQEVRVEKQRLASQQLP